MNGPAATTSHARNGLPAAGGLYDPAFERDGCGVACLARLDGQTTRETVERAIGALVNLEHRGAEGADASTGDGAGILMQIPDAFLRAEVAFDLPPAGAYGVATGFLPQEEPVRAQMIDLIEKTAASEGLRVIGWRDLPVDPSACGVRAGEVAPFMRHLFLDGNGLGGDDLERRLYVFRRRAENAGAGEFSLPSCSSRTIVYKGMLSAPQLANFYPDLADERLTSALAIVHSRFSTNTFPSWALAHPFHMSAHNGEFNTLLGNVSWMRAREARLAAGPLGPDVARTLPAIPEGSSDSAAFDAVLELLVRGGRSLPHAVMLMTPEAHEKRPDMPAQLRDFYDYGSMLMEPWDGPASVTFTDGRMLGATLDRNGLRPGRWVQTRDGWFALASEAGAFGIHTEDVDRVGRLLPGRLVVVDPERGGLLEDREAETAVATQRPYGAWYAEHSLSVGDLPAGRPTEPDPIPRMQRQLAFGWTQEDLKSVLAPVLATGGEAIGSMGADAALAALSRRQPPLFSYFKQLFAQVTNPAIDPVRENIVMSLRTVVGPEGDLFEETEEQARRLVLEQPLMLDDELARLRAVESGPLVTRTLDATWPIAEGPEGLDPALTRLCEEADAAISAGAGVIVVSDKAIDPGRAPVPSLLALSCVHHHLVRAGTRTRVGIVVETGEARDPHHMASLIGYGAAAVNPYLMLESTDGGEDTVVKSMGKSLLKIISKMGISTIRSYNGAQVFEAVGLDYDLVHRHFTGTPSRIGGIGLDGLAREALHRHARAWPDEHGEALPDFVEEALLPAASSALLPQGGQYQWRRDGERHMWEPGTITSLQKVARGGGPEAYREFAERVDRENAQSSMLRGLMKLRTGRERVPLSEVEPVAEIVKRFTTGAMSLGSLSSESHETLAIAMNRLGGRSNTGEGGEDPRRFAPDPNGDLRRSAIKQVASGRFGVTADYLVNADQIQIKVAQGAKPGEGGQLPGHKITAEIGRLRHSTPGVELISPPPHHDIYSIEDLKQLIYDLRCANPRASISVKLCAEVGVGTVAAGVVKANADHIVIAGHDGGTGAAALSSIHSAGVPWEIGLAETQQTLIRNDLRSRVMLQADGQIRTGRDVVIAALLGADEVGFSTAPLVATGCVMMRVCHLNTCPVGIATQDLELRKRFQGTPEHVVTYLLAVAEHVRWLMADLGVRTYQEMVGRVDLLEMEHALEHWKAEGVDLGEVLSFPEGDPDRPRRHEDPPTPVLDNSVDHLELLPAVSDSLHNDTPVRLERTVRNVDRTVGGLLSGEIVRRRGPEGLPEGTIDVVFEGSAGQSFGAWLAPGVSMTVEGTVNDYAGKGLSGGVIAVRPPGDSHFNPHINVCAGNVALYGATQGRAFFRGMAGERFAVRNSGAHAVVEGVGDHGCEYMTGGRVLVLGPTGVNFAAGMSGGIAWVLNDNRTFAERCNQELVDLEQPAPEDYEEIRKLLVEHFGRTRSPWAEELLDDESTWANRLTRVMPRDYRAALEREAEEEERRRSEGLPV